MVFTLLIQQQPATSPIMGFLPILLIFAVFYFLLFMPMQRQKKAQQRMLRELQNGQSVLTSGGIIGTIVTLDDDTVVLRVKPDNVKLQVARSSVASVVSPDAKKLPAEAKK